jgi:hypothetical protein
MTTTLAIAGILISGAALGISAVSAVFSRRQLELGERQRERDFEATVVAELVGVHRRDAAVHYEVSVTNAGPAVARDVDVSLVEWTDATALGRALAEADVAPALLRGERRTVILKLAAADARFDDRSVSIELHADYYDDNGVRNERLAFVSQGSFVLTPAPPAIPAS